MDLALNNLQMLICHETKPTNIRKCTEEYKLSKSQEKIAHQIYMDDTKLFAKSEKEQESLTQAVRIYGDTICYRKMRYANNKKHQTALDRLLEADIIKQVEMKEKIKKEYHRRTRTLLETKLFSRNVIK